jgi:hypothetical protein
MHGDRQIERRPDVIGGQHGDIQPDAQAQTGAVTQGQAILPGLLPKPPGDFGFLRRGWLVLAWC